MSAAVSCATVVLCVVLGATAQRLQLPELPYAYDALEPYIDAHTMRVHHTGHHAAYTKKTNDVLSALRANASTSALAKRGLDWLLQHLDAVPAQHREALRNNGGGFVNHEFFWRILAPRERMRSLPSPPAAAAAAAAVAADTAQATLMEALDADAESPASLTFVHASSSLYGAVGRRFGGWDRFVAAFSTSATTAFGSAWVWLALNASHRADDPAQRLVITTTPNQDSPLMTPGLHPIVGLDLWEHAYYLKHQNRRTEYVQAFFKVLNFREANARYEAAAAVTDAATPGGDDE